MTAKPATILASETRLMKSKHTGRTYRITISLPYAYSKPGVKGGAFDNAPAAWPVVYLLDANWFFGMVTDTVRAMAWCGRTTEAIVVGIGYSENADPQETFREAMARRENDFTPVRSEVIEKEMTEGIRRPVYTGDAGNFLKFIKDELTPQVEKEFRADPSKRILAGHSLGGLFAAFALFEGPDLFNTFIIGSPYLAYGDKFTFKHEEAFAQKHKKLPANVYLFAGELEESVDDTTLTDSLRFAAVLQSRKYKGLSLVNQVFVDQNHCEVTAPGFQAGLKFALKKS